MNLIELEWQYLKRDEIPELLLELAYAVINGVDTRGQKGNYRKQRINFNNNSPSSADCSTPMQVQVIAEAVEDLTITVKNAEIPKPIPKPKHDNLTVVDAVEDLMIPAKNVEIYKPIPKPKLIKRENWKD
ncbi:hypothetical protein [Trichormus azollae]|jgi:putative transposase|uniref:hypothetical protein n=1 Tax=Trichormus azollae TaxID=1164 RepID=UPI000195748F|nr:hypothetical protein [Trichormus azollae]